MKKLVTLLLVFVLASIPASTACAATTTTPAAADTTAATAYDAVPLILYTGAWGEVLPIKVVIGGRWVSVPMKCYVNYCRGEIQIEFGDHQLAIFNHDGWVIWTMVVQAYGRTVKWVRLPGVRSYEIGSVIPTCQLGCYNGGIARGRLFCVPTDLRNPPAGGCRLGGGGGSQWWLP